MDTRNVYIHAFIHDLKIPLAVIELSVRKLLSLPMPSGPLDAQRVDTLRTVGRLNAHNKDLANCILTTAKRAYPKMTFDYPAAGKVFQPQTAILKRKPAPSQSLNDDVVALQRSLATIKDKMMEFEDAQIAGQWSSQKTAKVINRIRRNVLSAINLLNNASMFLSLDQVSIHPTEVVLSAVMNRAVIEVSDLKSAVISENLQLDSPLGQVKSVCRQGGLMLHVDSSLWDRRVRIDQDRVNQVIVNLLLNAFKHRKKIIDMTARYRDRHLHLSVKDDGKGIARFGREVEKETSTDLQCPQALTIESHGIGLFLVQVILSEIGGQLTIESPPGQGATFTAVIPC